MDPLNGTVPIPLSILAEMAFEEVQVRVEDPPGTTVAGAAEMLTAGLAAKVEEAVSSIKIITERISLVFNCMDHSLGKGVIINIKAITHAAYCLRSNPQIYISICSLNSVYRILIKTQ
jgi:hypothetical protein